MHYAHQYNGKVFNQVEIKPEVRRLIPADNGLQLTSWRSPQMTGFYLAEFSMSYRPVGHGRPGIGSTTSSRFIPLK